MKKTILYASFVSLLAISNAMAGGINENESDDVPAGGASHQLLEPSYSDYQQPLLEQWQNGKIGGRAWSELGKQSSPFSAKLFEAIQENLHENPEKVVDIFYVNRNYQDFTLKVDMMVTKIYVVH